MFLAFRHKKTGRWAPEELDSLTRDSEDALTAMVIGRLQYLPAPLALSLLVGATSEGVPSPFDPSAGRMTFWPRLPRADAPERYVEPDVVWEGESQALVIEVKWNSTQTAAQLDSEYAAAALEYATKEIMLLALGGFRDDGITSLTTARTTGRLLVRDWRDFADAARRARDESPPGATRNVLHDIVEILEWRGLRGIDDLKMLDDVNHLGWRLDLALCWGQDDERSLADLAQFAPLEMWTLRDWRPT